MQQAPAHLPRVSSNGPPIVVIVGLGFGGLACAVNLKIGRNLESFVIFEKSNGVAGTWRHQRYPGAACDVPAHYYSISAELNPNWSSEFPPRQELKDYLQGVYEKHDIGKYTRANSEIVTATWNEGEGVWDLHIREYAAPRNAEEQDAVDGEGHWGQLKPRELVREYIYQCNILFNTCGFFTKPYYPDYPGMKDFKGDVIHTVEWNDHIPLAGRRVAIVGTGPTSLQVVSQIAGKVSHLTVYQRTAAWIFPWAEKPFSEEEKARYRRDPAALRAKRQSLVNSSARTWLNIEDPNGERQKRLKVILMNYLKKTATKPGLVEKLTPVNMPVGCKRLLIDCGYIKGLNMPHVDLVTGPIQRVTEKGIVHKDKETGVESETQFDVIIWATGWGSMSFGRAFPLIGRGGKEIWEAWRERGVPMAYLGVLCHGFPNLFLASGPGGGPFDSFVEGIELRVDFLLQCIDELDRRNAQWIDARPNIEKAFSAVTCKANANAPFGGTCISYYKFRWDKFDPLSGGVVGKQAQEYEEGSYVSPAFFPGLTSEYRDLMEKCDMDGSFTFGPKKGKWVLPPPGQDLRATHLRPEKLRENSESLLVRTIATMPEIEKDAKTAFAGLYRGGEARL